MTIIYIRMKHEVWKASEESVTLKDIAHIKAETSVVDELSDIGIEPESRRSTPVVIDGFTVLERIADTFPDAEVRFVGHVSTLIKAKEEEAGRSYPLLIAVWALLFLGSGMAIMNFHYDVSMPEVHQKLHYLFTGEEVARPWLIQIPYSLGLGLGMLLFFNHWPASTNKKEPSPLDVEVFKYQEDLDQYVTLHNNRMEKWE